MFLTKEKITELTGFKRGEAQIHWLEREQFNFMIDKNSRPKVMRESVRARLRIVPLPRKEHQFRLK